MAVRFFRFICRPAHELDCHQQLGKIGRLEARQKLTSVCYDGG
jgi:hypothetical protein